MGRSFMSVRMGVRILTERWERAARTLPGEDRECAQCVVEMARRHASECFYAFDDPLEAAFFSVVIELAKAGREDTLHVDP